LGDVTAGKEAGLETQRKLSKNTLMSCHQNAGHSDNKNVANCSIKSAAKLKHLGRIITNQSRTHEEFKKQIHFGEYLILFSSEYVVFPTAISERKKKPKTFWEEIIAYFPLIRHGQHRKSSRCLGTIRDFYRAVA
jgi:hypothetical protein